METAFNLDKDPYGDERIDKIDKVIKALEIKKDLAKDESKRSEIQDKLDRMRAERSKEVTS